MPHGDGERLETDFQRQLEIEKLEALAEFAAGAGHEINNPLAVIAGRAQLLLRGERDPERRRELAVINGQAMRIHEMIADLMLYARPPQPQVASCDLAALVSSLVVEIRPRAIERSIELSLDVPGVPLVIPADATQLGVALKAMVENALAVLGPGGTIDVRVRWAGDDGRGSEAEVVVRDNGPGISPEVRRHLFDPFFSGRGAGRGLGMGLAKCWRIVTNHRGRIDVESAPGLGAAFTVRLPRTR
ncbi:MAG TPA: ATP-binding protein [Pirellulales bacterium]|nr:ATP-binding protein [Pirellulales bacterium]